MRKSLLRNSLLCGSLVVLSGCYSNGKFHSPTWDEMAWWRKDKAPDTSLAAAPSVTRPSDEALADRGSPGARAAAAPAYEANAAAYTAPPAGDNRYPDTGYPSLNGAPATGGANWAANNGAPAASVAANPYAKSAGGYDTGSRYDGRFEGRGGDYAQTTPYDTTYPGANRQNSPAVDENRSFTTNAAPARSNADGYAPPAGPRDNPYYRTEESVPASTNRYDEGRYTAPDRHAPSTASPTNDKYSPPGYASPRDAAARYNAEGYRDMTGDRYLTDGSRTPANAATPPASAYDARTADNRNADGRRSAEEYSPGKTGYQPAGTPIYEMPTANGNTAHATQPYQPGGTSRYEGPASRTADSEYAAPDNGTRAAPSGYGSNPYAEPLPADRYQDSPATSREGAARY